MEVVEIDLKQNEVVYFIFVSIHFHRLTRVRTCVKVYKNMCESVWEYVKVYENVCVNVYENKNKCKNVYENVCENVYEKGMCVKMCMRMCKSV